MSLYKDFVKDNVLVLGGNILVYAKGIILLPLIIKYFGVPSYGAYSLFASYVSIVYGISSLGVGFRFQRYMPSASTPEERRGLFYPQFLFRAATLAVLGTGFLVSQEAIDSLFLKTEVEYSAVAVLIMLVSMLLFAQSTDYFRYTARMKYFVMGTSSNPYLLIGSLLLGVLIFKQSSLDFLLYSSSGAMLVACLPLVVMIGREIGLSFSFYKPSQLVSDMKLGFPITLSVFLDFLMAGSDRFVIAYFLSATAVGFYAPAYTLASLIIVFPKVLGVVLPPLLSKAVDTGQHDVADVLVRKATNLFLLFIVPYIAAMLVLARPILALLANEEIASSVSYLTPIIGVGFIFYGLNIIFAHNVAFTKLQTKWILYSNTAAGILSVSLNVLFMSFFKDLLIPALTSVASFVFAYFFLWKGIRRIVKVKFDWPIIGKVLMASLLMSLVVYSVTTMNLGAFATVLVAVPTGLIAYAVLVFAFRILSDSEIRYAKEYLRELRGGASA